jgi:hypothetical protein
MDFMEGVVLFKAKEYVRRDVQEALLMCPANFSSEKFKNEEQA